MNININEDYKLTDNEKYYIINLILSVFDQKKTRSLFIKLANSINSLGPKSVDDLINITSYYAVNKSRFDKNKVISSILPSIEYFFNDTKIEIRKRSFNIDILN